MARRDFAGNAVKAQLGTQVSPTDVTVSLSIATGWPTGANGKFLCCFDRGGTEEKFWATSRSGLVLTLASSADRGAEGTAAATHAKDVYVEHVGGSTDLDEANSFINSPGLVGSITSSSPGDTAAAGAVGKWADVGHRHARETAINTPALFQLLNSGTLVVSNNALVTMPYNTEPVDTDGGHDNVTNNSRYTIPTGFAGTWIFRAGVSFPFNATGYRQIYFTKNGGGVYGSMSLPANGTVATDIQTQAMFPGLIVGDYIQVVVLQTSGGSLTLPASNAGQYYSGNWVRA